jgi:putative transposase
MIAISLIIILTINKKNPMSQSLSQIYVHMVFSTKNRINYLSEPKICDELYAYIVGILKNIGSEALIINGASDHIHILCTLPRSFNISNMIKEIKRSSSLWIKTKEIKLASFQWQAGYGVFSVSYKNLQSAKHYIENQQHHHKNLTFKEELIKFLRDHNMEINEKYLWD